MSAWTNGTYTHKGLALLAKLTQGSSLKITKAVSGTGYVTPANLANQTAVTGAKQQLTFQAASYPSAGTCKLPMFLTNKGVATGYKAKQIGLYAYDPVEGEILYFIAQSANGTEVPSESEMPDYSATWTFYFRYGQADNVDVTVDPSHTVTTDMLNEVRAIAESGVSAAKQGEVVVCENSANLPFAGLRIFGKSTQNGVPAPENPVEIVSIENPTVTVHGKNLLPDIATNESYSGVTIVVNSDKSITVNGTATENVFYAPYKFTFKAGRSYVLSGCPKNGTADTYFMYINNLGGVRDYGNGAVVKLDEDFTSDIGFAIRSGTHVNNLTFYPMIKVGYMVDEFEPSRTPQTIELTNTLHGIPVTSGGNYTDENGQQWICDEVDFARGVYIRRIKTVNYDGDEAWAKSGTYSYYTRATDSNGAQPMCNRLTERTSESQPYIRPGTTGDGVQAIIVSFGTGSANTAEDFKALLAQNPLTVLYALSTPTETVLTPEELAAYAAMTSHNPVTTVMNDGGAWMEVDCIKAQNEAAFRRAVFGNILTPADYGETLPATATAGRIFFKKVT